jgi:allantoin racemase
MASSEDVVVIPTRVWYQSHTEPEKDHAYTDRLATYLAEIGGPETTFEIHGVSPAETVPHRLSELRCAARVVINAVEAEEAGYDGVLLGHFQEAGLDEARSAVDIPVVGMAEASMLHALQLGRTFGLISLHSAFTDWHRFQAARLGVQERLTGVSAIEVMPEAFVAAFNDPTAYDELRAKFVAQGEPLVAAGAEVLIPAGGLFTLMSSHEKNFAICGAPVLNPIAIGVRAVQTAVWLRRLNGTSVSRAGAYVRAPRRAVDELRASVRS